jgi:hypothetical protein
MKNVLFGATKPQKTSQVALATQRNLNFKILSRQDIKLAQMTPGAKSSLCVTQKMLYGGGDT